MNGFLLIYVFGGLLRMINLNLSIDFIFVASAVLFSWIITNLLKPLLNKDIFWNEIFSKDGGMPSAHTTPASALVFSIFLIQGFSISLVIAIVFLIALMRDAVGVRYTVGHNSLILNKLVKKNRLSKVSVKITEGHTPIQVFAGFLVGLFVTIICYWVFFL